MAFEGSKGRMAEIRRQYRKHASTALRQASPDPTEGLSGTGCREHPDWRRGIVIGTSGVPEAMNRIARSATIAIMLAAAMACGSEDEADEPAETAAADTAAAAVPTTPSTPVLAATATKEPEPVNPKQWNEPPPMTIDVDKRYTATFALEKGGEFVIELYPKEAPTTVNSFVFLSREGFYDGVTFHRVLDGFMAQGGDPTGTGFGGPGYEFDNEPSPIRRHDSPGVLSMANGGVRNGRGTNGSQFFITFGPTPGLDGYNPDGTAKDCSQPRVSCHTVFGKVIQGMDVVSSITRRDPQGTRTPGDAIKTVSIEEN